MPARRALSHKLARSARSIYPRTRLRTLLDVNDLDDRRVADSVQGDDAVTLRTVPGALCVLDGCCKDLVGCVCVCGTC